MLIDLFIKAGWHTVPLKGELKRLETGKKTLPIFESDWRKTYTKEFNTSKSAIAGAITGSPSGIIAIDCDSTITYSLFKSLDPTYTFHFISKGKKDKDNNPIGGGTIIYKYSPLVGSFKLTTDQIKLDFYSDEGFIYLPTEGNETKESWIGIEELPELKEAPDEVIALLQAFKAKSIPVNNPKTNVQKSSINNRLAPLLETFVKSGTYDPTLFKILTPYSFRDLPTYASKGHLHPNDVPEGRGSEYLSKISAILGADISVNIELYTKTIQLINSFWDNPMEKTKLLATVINPMVEERATINGKVIWQYDKHWEKLGFIATALNGDYLESFYDDIKGTYYLVNYSVPYIKAFGEKRPVINTLRSLLGRLISEVQYDSVKQITRTTLNPSLEFGRIEGSDEYNLFRQTQELSIITNPAPYKANYVRPTTIISYLESLIPDDNMRLFVLSFIKTKLCTFKYSPIILYFIGKPGSGKDTLVNLLRIIIGADYVAKPDTKIFLEQYNGWLMDKFFVQLDEYGNKLVRSSDKQEVLGKLKAYTGAPDIQIRAMRENAFNYKHSLTFILTANSNPIPVEMDDRRIAFIKTPNKLEQQQWVKDMGGISVVQDRMLEEVRDFCYYLGTEIPQLPFDNYMVAPITEDKEKLMLDNLPAAEQIAFYVQNSRFEELLNLAEEYGVDRFDEDWSKNKLQDSKIEELYSKMTDGAGSHRAIIKTLKNIGVSRAHTTKNCMNVFYYFIKDLHRFAKAETEENNFQSDGKTTIKGLS